MPYKNYQEGVTHRKLYYIKNRKRLLAQRRKFRLENPEHIKMVRKKYRDSNIEKFRKYDRDSYKRNRQKKLLGKKIYFQKNKDKIYCYKKNKQLTDIQFLISNKLRSRFRRAVSRNYRNTSVIKLTGCSIEYLKLYLEKQFQPKMSWDNYGKGSWHIDHIRPCSSFDLTNPEEQKKCFHYSNLQPLWEHDNLSKNDKWVE